MHLPQALYAGRQVSGATVLFEQKNLTFESVQTGRLTFLEFVWTGQLQICRETVQKVVCLDRLHTTRQDADKGGCLNNDAEQETRRCYKIQIPKHDSREIFRGFLGVSVMLL